MHRRGDNPPDAESDGPRENGGCYVALLDDFLAQIDGRDLGQRGGGDDEEAYAQTGEDQGIQDWNIGHSARIDYDRSGGVGLAVGRQPSKLI
jgi:hypothetical protein